ncbi:hypothetical protein PYW08_012593 [Mythimna loreyi]|uniref:Uncharacterized protein n=1 Tax=Mythimna loreyi TaxID=667449 RepID=A0ACC2Q1H0_9NEOP|nr:hypothetical protein PYW08_012593 [Mythimna loreyi]
MHGVKIEAKHSAAGAKNLGTHTHTSPNQCHHPLACFRCGDRHVAKDCPRPREEPATCANCGGPHPACNVRCPVFQKEMRNRRAGTVAISTQVATRRQPPEDTQVQDH